MSETELFMSPFNIVTQCSEVALLRGVWCFQGSQQHGVFPPPVMRDGWVLV